MRVRILDAGDLKAISKALKQQADGKQLRKELVAELKATARPLVPKVKAAWLAAPEYKGQRSRSRVTQPDLRKLLADSTWLQVRLTGKTAGVRVRSDGRKMPNRMKALPGYVEGIRRRPWRHPVFPDAGSRHRFTDRTRAFTTEASWVAQRPFPRFYAAVQPDEAEARRRCINAVDKVFNEIARSR